MSNVTMRARKSATELLDLVPVRCDESGRLLVSSGTGISAIGSLTTTAPAYTAGDSVGGEDFSILVTESFAPIRLDSVTLVDPAAQAANLLLMIFAGPKSSH